MLFLMLIGLSVNVIYPVFGIKTPLTLVWLNISIVIAELLLLFLAKMHITNMELKIGKVNLKCLFTIIFPTLSLTVMIIGTLILNSGGSNVLVILSYIMTIVTIIITSRYGDETKDYFYVYTLFFVALTLLFSYSLRSAYVLGFDINAELKIFLLTKEHGLWSLQFFKNAYNTCLSISILPTIISSFVQVSPDMIFKVFFTIVLSLIPPVIYLITKIFSSSKLAFFTALFFAIQSQFILQAPAISRQSVALLFFTLTIYFIFNQNLSYISKQLFIIFFGCGMVVSHYSTTYVAILVITGTYILTKLFNLTFRKEIKTSISFLTASILIAFTLFWNSILTENSITLINTFSRTLSNMSNFMSYELRSEFIRDAFFTQKEDYTETLNNYYAEIKEHFGSKSSNFDTKPYPSENNTPIINLPKLSIALHVVVPILFRVSLFIGFIILTLEFKRKNVQTEFYVIIFIFVVIVAALITLPYISMTYNLERLYQQSLVVLAYPIILALHKLVSLLNRKIIHTILAGLVITYLLINVGFTDRVLAGIPTIILDNKGEHYDRYYKSLAETKAVDKLTEYFDTDKEIKINADRYAVLRISPSIKLIDGKVNQNIVPETIEKNSYTFLSTINVMKNKGFVSYNDIVLTYYFPTHYLETTKNLIYSTNRSKIFK